MNPQKRKALEAAGFRLGDAGDFLDLTEVERAIVDVRLEFSRRIREARAAHGLTQADLAHRMKSSQSRVAKLEAAAPDVSLDLMLRGFLAAGGTLADLARVFRRSTTPKRAATGQVRPKRVAATPRQKSGVLTGS